jgi:hypothetical protein
MRIFYLPVLFIFLFGLSAEAQDKIYRKNGQMVKAKILEIGSSEVKYKVFDNQEGPIYSLETDRISKIVFVSGKVEKFTPDLKDPELYVGQKTKAIKVDFLGPLLGYTQITYEKSNGVGKGYELTLGIIGAGKNQRIDWYDNTLRTSKRSQFGFSAGIGYKFSKLPDFLFNRVRFSHLLQGAYAKPVFYIGNYSENRLAYKNNMQYEIERTNTTFAALQVELGKQWVFGESFPLDLYWGIGYGFDNKKQNEPYGVYDDGSAYNYINARAGSSPGLSFTFGLKVGWLLK